MPVINVRNIGSVGVNSDIEPWDLPPDALSEGINYRLSANKLQSVGGTMPISPDCGDRLGYIGQSTDFDGNSIWVVCGEDSIKLFNGQEFIDVGENLIRSEPRFSGLDSTLWTACQIGQVVFLNHPQLYPVFWVNDGGNTDLEPLWWHIGEETWESKGYSCRMLCAHKNFLFALGMQEGADLYADKVWWSHPAEPNGIPFSWRTTLEQPDSIAGYVNLGRGGTIVGGESLRDSFVIYSDKSLNVMDFTGDALGWRRRTVSTAASLTGEHSLIEHQGRHFFVSPRDILTFDGNSISSIMHNRLRRRLASRANINKLSNSWAAHNPAFNEIWFGVPEGEDEYPRMAYVYNYRDDNWGIRDLELQFAHACFGKMPRYSERTWSNIDGAWSSNQTSWSMSSSDVFGSVLIGVTEGEMHNIDVLNETYEYDFGSLNGQLWDTATDTWATATGRWTDVSPGDLINLNGKSWITVQGEWDDTFIEWDAVDPRENYERAPTVIRRTDLPIGGHEVNTTITRIYPLIEGTSEVYIKVGSQQHAGGPIRWAGDYRRFIPGRDRKIDVRTTGECHCYEIKSESGSFFNLTGMDIEFHPAGVR